MFFFDERFAQARLLVRQLTASELTGCELAAVQSDVTPIRSVTLERITQSASTLLRGITTESFHFCLTTMLREHARIETEIERMDRDLWLWSTRTTRSDKTTSRLMGFSDG